MDVAGMDVAGMDVAGCGLCGVAHVDAAVGAAALHVAAHVATTHIAATHIAAATAARLGCIVCEVRVRRAVLELTKGDGVNTPTFVQDVFSANVPRGSHSD